MKILNEKISNEDLIHEVKDLILEIEYDDFEEDVTSCFDRIIELNPDNQNIWFSYISFLENYVGDEIDSINDALIHFPDNERLLEMKCNYLIEYAEDGIEILKILKILKKLNPSNGNIEEFKEAAIEILIEAEEDENSEVMELIESI